jgi:hypothetical protein
MTLNDTNSIKELKKEAAELREPQCHTRKWFKRVDRLLYLISLLEDVNHDN